MADDVTLDVSSDTALVDSAVSVPLAERVDSARAVSGARVEAVVQRVALAIDSDYLDPAKGLTTDEQIAFLLRLKTHYDNSLAELQRGK